MGSLRDYYYLRLEYIVQFDKVTVSSAKHYLPSLKGGLSFKDITGSRKDGRFSFMIKQNTNLYHVVKRDDHSAT